MSLFTVTFDSSDDDTAKSSSSNVCDEIEKEVVVTSPEKKITDVEDIRSDTPVEAEIPTKVNAEYSETYESESERETETPRPRPPESPTKCVRRCEQPAEQLTTNYVGITDSQLIRHLNAQIQRLPNHEHPDNLIPYEMVRKTSMHLKGKRTEFTLYRDGKEILYSKIKTKGSTDTIIITKGKENFHFSSANFEAVILTTRSFTSFSLRLHGKFGPELMNIKYSPPTTDCAPRVVSAFLFSPPDGVEPDLRSKDPVITAAQTWILNLKGRIGKRSIKNCILVDSQKNEIMSVMKTHSSTITIETVPQMSELCVFMLGVSSFLCTI